jgi:hypothetical protein
MRDDKVDSDVSDRAFDWLQREGARINTYNAESDISRINRSMLSRAARADEQASRDRRAGS